MGKKYGVWGAVADDLTGSSTMGVLLARSQVQTEVFLDTKACRDAKCSGVGAMIICTDSRALAPGDAYTAVKEATLAMKEKGASHFSKRIDTTLRGRIGSEIDAMLDQMDEGSVAVVVPAMPASRRIVVGGYSVIDNVVLTRTPVAHDVKTPVKESYVPKLLAEQTRRQIGLVQLGWVLQGAESVKNEMRAHIQNGCSLIVVDAISEDDLEVIAEASSSVGHPVLCVDPGPFTAAMMRRLDLAKAEESNFKNRQYAEEGTVLLVAGSATPVTLRQMNFFLEDDRHVRISVDPYKLIEGGETADKEIDYIIERVHENLVLGERSRAVLLETALHGVSISLDEEDKKRRYPTGTCSHLINWGMGQIVSGILNTDLKHIAGLYCTGGDTEVNVCRALGANSLEMVDYVIPQTDVARLTGKYEGVPIIGKGGLTGDDMIVFRIVDRLFAEATMRKGQ